MFRYDPEGQEWEELDELEVKKHSLRDMHFGLPRWEKTIFATVCGGSGTVGSGGGAGKRPRLHVRSETDMF